MNNDGVGVRGFHYTLETLNPATGLIELTEAYNRIPQLGLDFLIQAPFGDTPPIGAFYCTLFTKDFVPTSLTTAADLPSVMGEFVSYDELSRPLWDRAYNGAGTISNFAAKAVFTPTVDAWAYGACIVSSPTKGAPDGLLLSVVRFGTRKPLSAGEEAKLVAGLTYIPTNAT